MKIAIVGTGIAGNVVAHRLHAQHDITVYESGSHVGGHTHTHRIELDGEVQHIDTGFIVYNRRTYPHFSQLLDDMGVATQPSTMSFSVRNEKTGLEYNGTSLDGLFAQRSNLLRPGFHRMILQILRFNREAPDLLDPGLEATDITLGDYLEKHGYGARFINDYLVPMGAAIWSTDPKLMLDFPARFFVRFLHHHGMLSVNDRPTWRVVKGGSARYVEALVAPWRSRVRLNTPVSRVERRTDGVWVSAWGAEPVRYDHVFLACHADDALRMLQGPTPAERAVLSALPYQENEAVLHTDDSLLPRRRRAWAAWNYHVLPDHAGPVALTYNMNMLQGLTSPHTYCVTLNRTEHIDPQRVLRRVMYRHPLFTVAGAAAQRRHREISGVRGVHYCGAYWRNGFHEDGMASALEAVARFEEVCDAQRDLSRVC